jgi:uncharacterized protein
MTLLVSALAGLVFGLGLIAAGMTDPAKVLAFLDLAGAWDPSLALVIAAAIGVGLPAFAIATRRDTSWSGAPMRLPVAREIDRRLVLGSLLFGVGWGIAGFCPGPALVALGMAQGKAAIFVVAMIAGMAAFERLERSRRPPLARA